MKDNLVSDRMIPPEGYVPYYFRKEEKIFEDSSDIIPSGLTDFATFSTSMKNQSLPDVPTSDKEKKKEEKKKEEKPKTTKQQIQDLKEELKLLKTFEKDFNKTTKPHLEYKHPDWRKDIKDKKKLKKHKKTVQNQLNSITKSLKALAKQMQALQKGKSKFKTLRDKFLKKMDNKDAAVIDGLIAGVDGIGKVGKKAGKLAGKAGSGLLKGAKGAGRIAGKVGGKLGFLGKGLGKLANKAKNDSIFNRVSKMRGRKKDRSTEGKKGGGLNFGGFFGKKKKGESTGAGKDDDEKTEEKEEKKAVAKAKKKKESRLKKYGGQTSSEQVDHSEAGGCIWILTDLPCFYPFKLIGLLVCGSAMKYMVDSNQQYLPDDKKPPPVD